jgi:hypothetical protein
MFMRDRAVSNPQFCRPGFTPKGIATSRGFSSNIIDFIEFYSALIVIKPSQTAPDGGLSGLRG